jgi:hypothetical protein
MIFTNDELFLALVSLVRATRPAMLRQDAEGFSIDFESIAAATAPLASDRLLLKLGAAMQGPPPAGAPEVGPSGGREGAAAGAAAPEEGSAPHGKEEDAAADGAVSLDLSAAEARQIAEALSKLEQLQAWPHDVMRMSRALRARLASDVAGGR